MNPFKPVLPLFVLFFILNASANAAQTVIELKKCPCASDQKSRNKTVLSNAIRPNVVVQLPEGDFSSDPVNITDTPYLTIKGVENPTTHEIKTRLSVASPGISLSNVLNMSMENLEIQGGPVTLTNSGDLKADNLRVSTDTGIIYTDCLQPNLDWLVPVISLILF